MKRILIGLLALFSLLGPRTVGRHRNLGHHVVERKYAHDGGPTAR
ncbi:hypothetical protein [Segatella salivae]|nr:hypothetical protein [Segatella salivae]